MTAASRPPTAARSACAPTRSACTATRPMRLDSSPRCASGSSVRASASPPSPHAMGGERIVPLGDAALTVALGDRVDAALSEHVRRAASAIVEASASGAIGGVVDVVPAYAALVVHYDPSVVAYGEMAARVRRAVREAPARSTPEPGRRHEIPVRYDGPDLADVARRCGLEEGD